MMTRYSAKRYSRTLLRKRFSHSGLRLKYNRMRPPCSKECLVCSLRMNPDSSHLSGFSRPALKYSSTPRHPASCNLNAFSTSGDHCFARDIPMGFIPETPASAPGDKARAARTPPPRGIPGVIGRLLGVEGRGTAACTPVSIILPTHSGRGRCTLWPVCMNTVTPLD